MLRTVVVGEFDLGDGEADARIGSELADLAGDLDEFADRDGRGQAGEDVDAVEVASLPSPFGSWT